MAGMARQVDEAYYTLLRLTDTWSLDRATGAGLVGRGADLKPIGLVRLGERRATGTVVLSRNTVTASTLIIPEGSVARTDAGILVRTTREVEITPTGSAQITGHIAGQDSAPVPAVALVAGEAGNIAAGALKRLQADIPGVDAVTNLAPFTGGRTAESDDELRARAKSYILSLARCGYAAIEYAVIGASASGREVTFARAIPNPLRRGDVTLYIDDGTGLVESTETITAEIVSAGLLGPPADATVGGEESLPLDFGAIRTESAWQVRVGGVARTNDVDVLLSPTDGRLWFTPALLGAQQVQADYVRFTGLIAEAQRVITGVPGDANYPGWGAAGNQVRVKAPRVVSPDFAGTLYLSEGTDRPTAVSAAESATIAYLNKRSISEDAVLAQIVAEVMDVPGVSDFVMSLPSENVAVLDDEIVRISAANVDYD